MAGIRPPVSWRSDRKDYAAHESSLRGRYLELDQTTGQDQIWQDVEAETGGFYRLSFDMWNAAGDSDVAPLISWNNQQVDLYSETQYGEARHFEFIVQGAAGTDRLNVAESGNGDGQGLLLDNFSLQYIATDKYDEFNFSFS